MWTWEEAAFWGYVAEIEDESEEDEDEDEDEYDE